MILLRLISWQYLRKHVLRAVLTTAGIVLGVAVFVGMHTANQSVLLAFNETVNRIAGATQLHVSAGEAGFDEEVLERVQSVPEVRVAVPVIEAVVETDLRGHGDLLILGVDMTGDRSLREYDFESADETIIDDPLVFLAQPDSLMITREFAGRTGLSLNTGLPLRTMDGEKHFTIRGIMSSGGLTSAFGGNLAVMDIYAAQKVFGRGRKFDRIDLVVKEGASVKQTQVALRNLLGPGFEVEPPSMRGQHFESMLWSYTMSVRISSLFSLFIGMFIIYNSLAIAVTHRRSEIGILRALGATRGQIRTLFLGEGTVVGLVGSAMGLVFGILLARATGSYIGSMIGQVYGVRQRIEEIPVSPELMLLALAIGVLTSIVAALIPARNAARVDPVQALQKGKYQVLSAGENRARRIGAAVLALISLGYLVLGRSSFAFYTGYLLAILAALLLTPTLALWLARTLRPALQWVRPVEGALAADSLIQAPRRTSATVAALMLSLAMVIGFGGVARGFYTSILDWMDNTLNPDLFVTPSENLASRTFRFPATMGSELEGIGGIAQVQQVHSVRILFRQTPVLLIAAEMTKIATTVRPHAVQGRPGDMYRLTAEGKGVMVSENLAGIENLNLNQMLEIPTPNGLLRLPIVGIIRDYSDTQGSIIMDTATFTHWWNDDTVDVFRVYLKPGVRPEDVRQAILEKFAGKHRVFVMTNVDLRSYVLKITDQWFGMTYVQIAVAILVAVLGIVNTLTVSITDRKRELGVLQAVGALRHQIRGTVWMEALGIGLIGLILGLALGAVNLYYNLEMLERDLVGMRLDYEFPAVLALILMPTILGAAFVSALWPAESAVRGSLVEALEYE